MALKYLAGERIIGTAAERAAMTTSVSAVPQTSWKELGRYTLTSGSTSIRVGTGTQTGSGTGTGNFTAKDNLMVLIHAIGEGETMHLRLGSSDTVDDDPNYAFRITHNGSDGSSADEDTETTIRISDSADGVDAFSVIKIRNILNKEKLAIGHVTESKTGESSEPWKPNRDEFVGKWAANAVATVLRIHSSGTMASGSEVVVLGCDDDEGTSGTNFWQELTEKELTGSDTAPVDTASFDAKRYLMFDMRVEENSTQTWGLQFNTAIGYSAGVYGYRFSGNGGNDGGSGSASWKAIGNWTGFTDQEYVTGFIVNKLNADKLIIAHEVESSGTGGASQPARAEWAGKWVNTSEQITKFRLERESASHGTFKVGTLMRVWGSN